MRIYLAVIGDGSLYGAATNPSAAHATSTQWWIGLRLEHEPFSIYAAEVSAEHAKHLEAQGTSGQFYPDGYDAMRTLESARLDFCNDYEGGASWKPPTVDICANCAAPLDIKRTGGCVSKDRKREFCQACSGISSALSIGARQPALLYDDGKGNATDWLGAIMGRIIHKHKPGEYSQHGTSPGPFLTIRGGMRGAVRYRVRMLDGSVWHGSGPTDNGNYIRLKPMKGQ
jgi:hypothetical protein